MAADASPWHVNDVVAYDAMRQLATTVQAHLVEQERRGSGTARAELLEVRSATLAIDGYDRAAVDDYTQQLQRQAANLARTPADGD